MTSSFTYKPLAPRVTRLTNPVTGLVEEMSQAQKVEQLFPDIEDIQSRYGEALINTPAGERGMFFSLDPGGIFGTRQRAIEESATKYDPNTGLFELNSNAAGLGITQQDVANYRLNQYQSQRKNTAAGRFGAKNFPEGQKPNAATPQLMLEKTVDEIRMNSQLTNTIKGLDRGPARLSAVTKKLGRKPNNSELRSLLSIAENETRDAVAGRKQDAANLESTDQETQASKDTVKLNQDIQRDSEKTNQVNRQTALASSKREGVKLESDLSQRGYENQRNEYEFGIARQEAQAERDFRKALADAEFTANLETVKLQNAAEMERYEMMLQNDREERQGDTLSELMAALATLGGTFMI